MISGALLGHFKPNWAVKIQPLSTGFIEIIKLLITPIIFLTISLRISGMGGFKKSWKGWSEGPNLL
jgi:aerobic C4-dicarboxylate transport protein